MAAFGGLPGRNGAALGADLSFRTPQASQPFPAQPRGAATLRGTLVAAVIYLSARFISALFMAHLAQEQPAIDLGQTIHVDSPTPASPGYWDVVENWDGQWFKTVALHGYVTEGPGPDPALAFPPLYPLLVRILMGLTGLPFGAVASTISLVAGCTAALLLWRWLANTRTPQAATTAVLILATFPSSPILQSAYSDGVALLLLVVALRAVSSRRWYGALGAAALLTYTRPVVLALAGFVLAGEVLRWRSCPREGRAWDRRALAVGAVLTVLSFAWPVTAGVIARDPTAYPHVLQRWSPTGETAQGWLLGMWHYGLQLPAVAILVILVVLLVLRWRDRFRARPGDHLATWLGVYWLFMLQATPPGTGVIRHALMALLPLGAWGPIATTRAINRRGWVILTIVVVAQLVAQYWWLREVFVIQSERSGPWLP